MVRVKQPHPKRNLPPPSYDVVVDDREAEADAAAKAEAYEGAADDNVVDDREAEAEVEAERAPKRTRISVDRSIALLSHTMSSYTEFVRWMRSGVTTRAQKNN